MTLANLTSRASNSIQDTMSDLNIKDMHWIRAVAAGSFITSVFLLIGGKRKAALAVAAAGTAIALMEDPEAIRTFWNNVPDYVETSQKFLGRVEGFVEQLASQSDSLKKTLSKVSSSVSSIAS